MTVEQTKGEPQKGFIGRALAFIPQVRQEIGKVTWPTRRETLMTTVFIFILAAIAAVYFTVVDQVIFFAINQILHLGS